MHGARDPVPWTPDCGIRCMQRATAETAPTVDAVATWQRNPLRRNDDDTRFISACSVR